MHASEAEWGARATWWSRLKEAAAVEAPGWWSFTAVMALLAVYAYFTGWVYLYYFFRHFGLSLAVMEIPREHIYVHAYSVLSQEAGIVLVAVALLLTLAIVCVRRLRWLTVPFLLALVPMCCELASGTADYVARALRDGRRDEPKVQFVFKDQAEARITQQLRRANDSGELRLIGQSKAQYIALLQPAREPGEPELSEALVLQVSKDDV